MDFRSGSLAEDRSRKETRLQSAQRALDAAHEQVDAYSPLTSILEPPVPAVWLLKLIFATKLSSRPERTRISCCAALTNGHVCGFQ